MIIKSDNIFLEDGTWVNGMVVTIGDRIESVNISADGEPLKDEDKLSTTVEDVVDATGMYVVPGFVDIHFHGCVGHDFCDGTIEAIEDITKYQVQNGVTSISPATMTLSREELRTIFSTAGEYNKDLNKACDKDARSTIRGITMEGPFVSMAKKGAQNGAYIHKPDVEFYREMQQLSNGLIKQIAVAPEEDDNLEFTKEISKENVISVAHTMATYDIADSAFKAGANHVTHLYNAMPPFLHRDPGVIGAAVENKNVYVEMICDGIHIHPAMVRAAFELFGSDRICMISDSMMATGLTDGDYSLGGQAVKVTGKKATLKDGTIAGSASNLMDCMRVAVKEMNIPLEDAIKACTITPAKSLSFDDECGSLKSGKIADMLILDKELNLVKVIKSGRVLVM